MPYTDKERFFSLVVSSLLTSAIVWTSIVTGCPIHDEFNSEFSVLESLECRNDYSTHISCSWKDDPQTPLSLLHMDPDDHRVLPCVQTPSQNPMGLQRVHCRYNTTLFAIGFDDVFFFQIPHSPGISKTFSLTKHEDEEGNWIISQVDKIPPPLHLTPDHLNSPLISEPLTLSQTPFVSHQLYYRQHDQERPVEINHEKVNEKRGMEMLIKPMQKEMEEKEKNNTTGEEGEVSFKEPSFKSDNSLPGPFNLDCVYYGERNLSCSWKLKRDLAQIMTYTLSYRTHSTTLAEWSCVEKVEVINEADLLIMVGVFSISEPGLLQVQLTPTPKTRVIRAYEHIQPECPTGLSVELRADDWILNWTLPKYRTVPLTSDLQYWSIRTPEDVKTLTFSDGVTVCAISERSLRGSEEYQARVRCGVSTQKRPRQRYAGYPSDWSNPVQWTARPETLRLVAFLLYFLIATLTVAVCITVFFILVMIQRRLREWEESLPSLLHSKVLAVSQREHLHCCTELGDPDISEAQIMDFRHQLCSLDLESSNTVTAPLTAGGNDHCKQTSQNQWKLRGNDPCPVSARTSSPPERVLGAKVLLRDSTFHLCTSDSHDAVLPCSEGYMQNPAGSQNALQVARQLNVKMDDGYMNCQGGD